MRIANLTLIGFLLLPGCRVREAGAAPKCTVIHMPKGGCPVGWTEVPDLFTEKDGAKRSACIAPLSAKLPACFDVLNPGESIHFTIPGLIGIPVSEKKDRRT